VIPDEAFCQRCGTRLRRRTSAEAYVHREFEIGEQLEILRLHSSGLDVEYVQLGQDGYSTNDPSAPLTPVPVRKRTDICSDVAALYFKNKQYEFALAFAKEAVELDKTNTPAWCYYIGSSAKLGRMAEAKALYKSIPNHPDLMKAEVIMPWLSG
jgi:tetratricopeptide (TPR) repeat protein